MYCSILFWNVLKFHEVFYPHDRNIGSSLEHNMEDSTIWSLPKRCRKVFPDCDRWYLLHMSTFSISSFGCTNLPNVDSTYSRGFVSNNYRILWISFFLKMDNYQHLSTNNHGYPTNYGAPTNIHDVVLSLFHQVFIHSWEPTSCFVIPTRPIIRLPTGFSLLTHLILKNTHWLIYPRWIFDDFHLFLIVYPILLALSGYVFNRIQ